MDSLWPGMTVRVLGMAVCGPPGQEFIQIPQFPQKLTNAPFLCPDFGV